MKDWVISTTVVLADGKVVKTRRRPRKSTTGYDLTRLIVGSGGTVGIVTEATLKLTALLQNQQVAVVAFPSIGNAVEAVTEMIQQGHQTEALELLDETAMAASNASGYLEREYDEVPTFFIKFAGPEKETVRGQIAAVRELMEKFGSKGFEASSDEEGMESLWGARKVIFYISFESVGRCGWY
jgi:D-lactate dehydrogenase (cytochrome)